MRLVRTLLLFTAFILLICSCRKEKSLENGLIKGVLNHQWQFTESSLHFGGLMDSAFISTTGTLPTLIMTGTDSTGKGHIVLQIAADRIQKGEYVNTQVLFQYSENDIVLYENAPDQPNEFRITITNYDSVSISGIFSGTVKDGLGNSKTITDGKFTVALTTDYLPPTGKGQLTVWTKQLCSAGGSIKIIAGDQIQNITVASAQEPVCGASDNTSFTLGVGPYTIIAVCGSDSLKYDITILENNCTNLEIDFTKAPLPGDYLPLTLGSYWDYEDLTNPNNTNRVTDDGYVDVPEAGRQYERLLNSFSEINYYRKNGSIYYQYKKLDFQNNVTNPPTIEIEILHDDYTAGQTWETVGIPVTVAGVPIDIKLRSAITQRDFQAVFFGTSYSGLIEVSTELLYSFDGGISYESSGSSYSTIFAKGIGIIYYNDLNRSIEWGLKDYHLNP